MAFAQAYLAKQALRNEVPNPHPHLQMGIVIPCYREPSVMATIDSLYASYLHYQQPLLVIVVVNSSERDTAGLKAYNRATYQQLLQRRTSYPETFRIFPILLEDIRHKHAGAGYARKIGMDTLVEVFEKLRKPSGVIISMDADTLVDVNFLNNVHEAYQHDSELGVATHGFRHPIDLPEYTLEHKQAIVAYELHMRYYKHALAVAGFPYAYYTVGSAFSCRAQLYVKQGGMNRRKAGEDFYFLHKLFPVARVAELLDVKVFPSARVSDRVPFGTGPQVAQLISSPTSLHTYALSAFRQIRVFLDQVPAFYEMPPTPEVLKIIPPDLSAFFEAQGFLSALEEIHQHSASFAAFRKRFFGWFDAFRLLKLLNSMHEAGDYAKQPVGQEAAKLAFELWRGRFVREDLQELLMYYREKEG